MKQKGTVEGVSRKLNLFELNGKTFFKGLGAKLSIGLAGVLAIGAVSLTALADNEGIFVSDANTEASTTTTQNNHTEATTTASATMSWWKAGVSEYDLTQIEEVTGTVKSAASETSEKTTVAKEKNTAKETVTVAAKTTVAKKEKKTATTTKGKTTESKSANKKTTKVIGNLYTQDDVKLRKKPSTSSDVIKIVSSGTKVSITSEEKNGFYRVKVGGKSGYIMASYLGTKPTKVTTTEENSSKECLGTFKITAYTASSSARTASGTKCKAGRTIAAPSRFTFGTKLMFNGNVYTVEDRGSAIVNNVLDLYVDSESEAVTWGVRYFKVYKVNN